eukprot:2278951-Amphidinium_carterae.2
MDTLEVLKFSASELESQKIAKSTNILCCSGAVWFKRNSTEHLYLEPMCEAVVLCNLLCSLKT